MVSAPPEQIPENQLHALRAFAEARGWAFLDHWISRAKDRRLALDEPPPGRPGSPGGRHGLHQARPPGPEHPPPGSPRQGAEALGVDLVVLDCHR